MKDDKNKDNLKINTVKTNLTSLTTVAKECLRTTEPKVNNHSESSVETPSQRKMSIELLQFHGGKEFTCKINGYATKSNFDTI